MVSTNTEQVICNRMLKYNIMTCRKANCKMKLLHCNMNIHSNKTCIKMKIIHKYAQLNITIHNTEAKKTQIQTLKTNSVGPQANLID
jgi:hypothetical protein